MKNGSFHLAVLKIGKDGQKVLHFLYPLSHNLFTEDGGPVGEPSRTNPICMCCGNMFGERIAIEPRIF